MQRSKTIARWAALAAALFVFVAAAPQKPKPKPYDLELEVYPAAPFPYFKKFGTIDVHVYPNGVRADSFWLAGFSRRGTTNVTIMNPVARMYTDMQLSEITATIRRASSNDPLAAAKPPMQGPAVGTVLGRPASRYRLIYGANAWIDIWTTREIPDNVQLRALVDSMVTGVSPLTAQVTRTIPGTPVYVELNFRRFNKVPFLRLKSLTWNNAGEADALKIGSYYIRAPFVDAIWK